MFARLRFVGFNTFREAVRDRVLYNLVFFALLLANSLAKQAVRDATEAGDPGPLPAALRLPLSARLVNDARTRIGRSCRIGRGEKDMIRIRFVASHGRSAKR